MERFGMARDEVYLSQGFTLAEIHTAKREGIEPAWLRHILDTYMEECGKVAKERRANRTANNG